MQEEKKYFLYIHKNKINRKCYVGITSQKNPKRRWHNGCNYKHSLYFYNAIQKYGWNNFEHIILFNNLDVEDANSLEKLYISVLRSSERQYGYNIALGGDCTTQVFTARPVSQYDYDGNLIKRYSSASEAEKEIGISSSGIGSCCKGKYSTCCGYLWAYDGDIPNINVKLFLKGVCQYDINGNFIKYYNDVRVASKNCNCTPANILRCCNEEQKTADGFIWAYKDKLPQIYTPNKNSQTVYKYTLNGEFVNSYISIANASNNSGINAGNIQRCCIDKIKTAGGFIWSYNSVFTGNIVKLRNKPVNQYDLSGNYIATYISTYEVSKIFNFSNAHISDCCNGKRKSSNGFKWAFVEN